MKRGRTNQFVGERLGVHPPHGQSMLHRTFRTAWMRPKPEKAPEIELPGHTNVESIIRWYLQFIPPPSVRSVLDIGGGRHAPYYGNLSMAGRRAYANVDIRPGPMVDVVGSAIALPFDDGSWEWGWCCEMLDHMGDAKDAAVVEVLRVCRNATFLWSGPPSPSFYADPGHTRVEVEWAKLRPTHRVTVKRAKSGRTVVALRSRLVTTTP